MEWGWLKMLIFHQGFHSFSAGFLCSLLKITFPCLKIIKKKSHLILNLMGIPPSPLNGGNHEWKDSSKRDPNKDVGGIFICHFHEHINSLPLHHLSNEYLTEHYS